MNYTNKSYLCTQSPKGNDTVGIGSSSKINKTITAVSSADVVEDENDAALDALVATVGGEGDPYQWPVVSIMHISTNVMY